MIDFKEFPKMARYSREIVITEKIDGTNAQILIGEDGSFLTGSRSQWIYPEKTKDNYGFSQWAHDNKEELLKLGPGQHFGEWFGQGIQRKYDMKEKRFALFNTHRWSLERPACCDVVPILYQGLMDEVKILWALEDLKTNGSRISPGFMNPEGVVIFHTAANLCFKKTIHKDEVPKSFGRREGTANE